MSQQVAAVLAQLSPPTVLPAFSMPPIKLNAPSVLILITGILLPSSARPAPALAATAQATRIVRAVLLVLFQPQAHVCVIIRLFLQSTSTLLQVLARSAPSSLVAALPAPITAQSSPVIPVLAQPISSTTHALTVLLSVPHATHQGASAVLEL